MIGWDKWCTVLAVFRHGTYSQAARALGMDATTIGRRVKSLESELGYDLFTRENDRLYPTQRCELLLTHLETAAEALREAEQETASAEQGLVWREMRMTAPPFMITNMFAPALPNLIRDRRLRVDLIATDSKVMLSRREVDIAIRIEDGQRALEFDKSRIDAEKICSLPYAIYAGRDDTRDVIPWAGIVEQNVRTSGTKATVDMAGTAGLQFQALHFETLRELAATGLAQAMLPRMMGDADTRLRCLSDDVLVQSIWMLSHIPDRNVGHLKAARSWVKELAVEMMQPL